MRTSATSFLRALAAAAMPLAVAAGRKAKAAAAAPPPPSTVAASSPSGALLALHRLIRTVQYLIFAALWAVVAYALGGLDALLRFAATFGGGMALGTRVALDRVALSLGEGTLELAGLRVDNYPGFEDEHLLEV